MEEREGGGRKGRKEGAGRGRGQKSRKEVERRGGVKREVLQSSTQLKIHRV